MNQQNIEIKKYLNVYQYLQDIYNELKATIQNFSYEQWAADLGVTDKSYVRMIVLGKRPLNEKMTNSFIRNLNLQGDEIEYFKYLVLYTQSKTHEQKKIFGQKMISLLKNELDQHEISSKHQFLSNPLMPRLQVLLSFYDLDQSTQNLAWLLGANEIDVEMTLKQLMDLNLVEEREGRFSPVKKSFKVPDHFGDFGLEVFYLKNLADAGEAIRFPSKERRFRSLLLPLNEDEFELYLENLNKFAKEQLSIFNSDYYRERRLYQVHFNIIPVTEKTDKTAEQETP